MVRLATWGFPGVVCFVVAMAGCSGSSKSDQLPAAGSAGMDALPPTAGVSGAVGGGANAGGAAPVAGSAGGGFGGGGAEPATDAGIHDAAVIDSDASAPELADCFALMNEHPSGSGATPYPGGRWSVPAATYGTSIEYGLEIEMSDGAVLIGDVSYPTDLASGQRATGDFPVLLTQNPYGAGTFGPEYGEIFVTHGYIFVSVDVRGTGRSGGGVHDLTFSPREAMDGAELIAWVAALEGSDGSVGLQGCSQLGINQLEAATQLGPDSPVKAMIPACPSGDYYRDTVFDNGVPSITAQFLVPDAMMGDETAYYREYWKARDRVARAPSIARAGIPLLLWSGWHEPGARGSLELYTVLQNVAAGRPESAPIAAGDSVSGKYQVIIGDWGHGGGLDLGIELQFFDTWIKSIDTGLAKETNTPLHIMELGGTERWFNARCYPFVQRYTPYFLASGGVLAPSADDEEDQEPLQWVPQDVPSDVIELATEPFADGAMLAGPLAAQLQVTSSNTNAQLFVELFDRAPAPGGTLTKLGFGSIIGSLRKTVSEKSWQDEGGLPARPYLALDEEQPMTAGERTELVVPLGHMVWSIEPGHSLVARIAAHPLTDDCIGVIVPPVGCYPTEPMLDTLPGGMYTLHLGGEHGSFISLPLLEHGAFPSIKTASSPTAPNPLPLPIDW